MKKLFVSLLAIVLLVSSAGGIATADVSSQPERIPNVGPAGGSATATALAAAMDIPADRIVSASLGTSDPAGTHVFTSLDVTSTGYIYPTGKKPTREPPLLYGYAGAKTYYQYAGWLANGDMGHYITNKYHIGQDIQGNAHDQVYAIADGEVVWISKGGKSWGWDQKVGGNENYGFFVKHKLSDGSSFLALYGHVQPTMLELVSAPVGKDITDKHIKVTAGQPFAELAEIYFQHLGTKSPTHLHFGICLTTLPPPTCANYAPGKPEACPTARDNIGWGAVGLNRWDDNNGLPETNSFVDPIDWMQTKTPLARVGPSFTSGFPIEGKTYAAISSGVAENAPLPNSSGSLSAILSGLNNSEGNDLVQLTLTLNVPSGSTRWAVDCKFLSEEYPEYVGTVFNDTFLIETPVSNFTIAGATVSAPNNVAFDQEGHLVSVNTTGVVGMSAANAVGTTYDGATATLTASAPIPSGASTVTLVFSVMDLGDSIYDTTVFLDNFQFIWPIHVDPIQSNSFYASVPPDQVQAIFSTSWFGSDVVMSLTTPSGGTIDRGTIAPDVIHELGPNYESYTIANPEAGDWLVNLYGADVPPEGEDVMFILLFSTVPPTNQPPIADAGADQTMERTSYEGADVTLDGSGSYDPEGEPLIYYDWTWLSGSASGMAPTVILPMGTTILTLEVSDGELTDTDTVEITIVDTTPPEVSIEVPTAGAALQDGITLTASASDLGGVSDLYFYVREPNGGVGVPIGYEDLAASLEGGTPEDGTWELDFNTLDLEDGYYVILAKAIDNYGNERWSEMVAFSIRNWAVIELLPASEDNKAGRTMPVKFSLRIAEAVDPMQPFVYNEELKIEIYNGAGNPSQTSTYGDTTRDYRIDTEGEKYITNFKTGKKPAEYTVEIWRLSNDFLIGSFTFETVK